MITHINAHPEFFNDPKNLDMINQMCANAEKHLNEKQMSTTAEKTLQRTQMQKEIAAMDMQIDIRNGAIDNLRNQINEIKKKREPLKLAMEGFQSDQQTT